VLISHHLNMTVWKWWTHKEKETGWKQGKSPDNWRKLWYQMKICMGIEQTNGSSGQAWSDACLLFHYEKIPTRATRRHSFIWWTLSFHTIDTVLSYDRHCPFIWWTLSFHTIDTVLSYDGQCPFIQWTLSFHTIDTVLSYDGHCPFIR